MSSDPVGAASARERNAPDAELGRIFERATDRLTTADLDRLIGALSLARTTL